MSYLSGTGDLDTDSEMDDDSEDEELGDLKYEPTKATRTDGTNKSYSESSIDVTSELD